MAIWEQRRLAVLGEVGDRTVQGSEYFRGIPFTFARFLAANLSLSVVARCCCQACVEPVAVVSHVRVCQAPVSAGDGYVEIG